MTKRFYKNILNFCLQRNDMITLAKFASSTLEQGKRILKVLGIGGSVYTAKESYPFGFDSVPPADWTAIYAETSNKDEAVIIGYINRHQEVGVGASRMYSVGADGVVKAYVVCDAIGHINLNGSGFSAVRFENLQNAVNATDQAINIELQKIAVAIASLGGLYTPGAIATNLTSSESATVKLK